MGFKRELGLFEAVTFSVGNMIGVGILIIPALAAEVAGPLSLLAWLITGVLSLLCGYCFAEMARGFRRAGGPYIYAKEALGETASFTVVWASLLGYLPSVAVMLVTLTYYMEKIAPLGGSSTLSIPIILIFSLAALNCRGVKLGARFQSSVVLLTCLLLSSLIALGIWRVNLTNFEPLNPYGWGALGAAMAYTIWPYFGWETVTVPTEEFKDPRREIPLGLTIGMGIVVTLYLLVTFVAMGTLSWIALSGSMAPLADLAKILLGGYGEAVMSVGALVIITANLNVNLLSLARLIYAASTDGKLPRFLGRLHHRYGTPYPAIISIAIVLVIIILSGAFKELILFSTVSYLIMYFLSFTSSIALRRGGRLERSRGKDLLAFIASILCVALILQSGYLQITFGVAAVTTGVLIYRLAGRSFRER